MNIDVRPTPALRRHRARIVGAVLAVVVLVTVVFSVAELADASAHVPEHVPVSDAVHR